MALAAEYKALVDGLSDDQGRISRRVPGMVGVDEDRGDWSFFQLLERNAIVNGSITATVCQLAAGRASR